MSWDGTERRADVVRSKFCDQHINLATDLAVIKECAKNIEAKMTIESSFRNGVVISLISMAFTLFLQMAVYAYFYGQLTKQVEVNTVRLTVVEKVIGK